MVGRKGVGDWIFDEMRVEMRGGGFSSWRRGTRDRRA
jgi:hypothetical protein